MMKWPGLVTAFLLFLGGWGCDPSQEGRNTMETQMVQLQGQTIPQGSQVASQWGPIQKKNVMTANWEFQTDLSASKYSAWVADRLSRAFERKGSSLDFARYKDGDSQNVSIRTALEKGRLHVWVSWSSSPD